MQKRVKKIVKPRYITIRIRYYPIDKEVLIGMLIPFVLFAGYLVFPVGNHAFSLFKEWYRASRSTVVFKEMPKVYQSPVLAGVFVLDKPVCHSRKRGNLGARSEKTQSCLQRMDSWPAYRNDKETLMDHVILNGSRDKKQVALTFDADMTPQMKEDVVTGVSESSYNKKVVDILNETQTKATIFTTGMWIELYPEVTAELVANPLFELGNHSYSHPGFDGACWGLTPLPDSGDREEIVKTQVLLKQFTHKDNKLFRFPGGCYGQNDLDEAWKQGLYVVHWDSVGNDGFNDDVGRIEANVLSGAKNGSIIVLHFNGPPNSPRTADALPDIISTLKENGFEFVKVSDLLHLNEKQKEISIGDFFSNIGYN